MWGVTLITVPTIAFGGLAVLGAVSGGLYGLPGPALTPLQTALYRAGHAHAGVLLILSLLLQLGLDVVHLPRAWVWPLRIAAPLMAILVPAGFFGLAHSPAFAPVLYLGGALVAVVTLTVGIGLVRAKAE